tara:strand:+ start:111 stop:257 length:147 start_codon:yes stop_codon:yes gene_type:complete
MPDSQTLAGVVLLEFVWIGFWFLVGVPFIAIMGIIALVLTLIGIAMGD